MVHSRGKRKGKHGDISTGCHHNAGEAEEQAEDINGDEQEEAVKSSSVQDAERKLPYGHWKYSGQKNAT